MEIWQEDQSTSGYLIPSNWTNASSSSAQATSYLDILAWYSGTFLNTFDSLSDQYNPLVQPTSKTISEYYNNNPNNFSINFNDVQVMGTENAFSGQGPMDESRNLTPSYDGLLNNLTLNANLQTDWDVFVPGTSTTSAKKRKRSSSTSEDGDELAKRAVKRRVKSQPFKRLQPATKSDDPNDPWSISNPVNARLVQYIPPSDGSDLAGKYRCIYVQPTDPSVPPCNKEYRGPSLRNWVRHVSRHGGEEQALIEVGSLAQQDAVAQASPFCERQKATCFVEGCVWTFESWTRIDRAKEAHMIHSHSDIYPLIRKKGVKPNQTTFV